VIITIDSMTTGLSGEGNLAVVTLTNKKPSIPTEARFRRFFVPRRS